MPKLEFTPVNDFGRFNFLGKRLFDFVNLKIQITTGTYVGDGATDRRIQIDIAPKAIIIFSEDNEFPIIWIDSFPDNFCKRFDGAVITNGIVGLSDQKDFFIIGDNLLANDEDINYFYIVFGE